MKRTGKENSTSEKLLTPDEAEIETARTASTTQSMSKVGNAVNKATIRAGPLPTNGTRFKVKKSTQSTVTKATSFKALKANGSVSTNVGARKGLKINRSKSANANNPNATNVDSTETSSLNDLNAAVVKDEMFQKVKATGKDKPNEVGTVAKTIVIKGKAPVDPECVDFIDTCHVFWEGDNIYDVMLNLTNVEKNNNKFAWLQLLEDDQQTNYYFWCRSGRIGYPGRRRMVDCGTDFYLAKNIFETEFRARTRNSWHQRHEFRVYPGKQIIISMDYNSVDEKTKKEAVNKIPKSSLYFRLQSLIELLFNIKAMEAIVTEMKYDAKNSPLGKLTAEQVGTGHDALVKISECIAQNKMGDELRDACNLFYTRIPHSFKMKRPPLITTVDELNQKFHLLKMLDDIQVAMAIINEKVGFDTNPLDSRYQSLKCDLIYIPAFSYWYRLVDKYLQNTHGYTHVGYKLELMDLFSYHREEEESNFNDVGNKMLLWHGTRLINAVRILKDGLKIAPPHVPGNGQMFGKGVYFADMSSKSANYCYATPERNEGILYLCEVALGNQYKVENGHHTCASTLAEGYHSVMGLGRVIPNPYSSKLLTGSDNATRPTTLPMGTGVYADPANPHRFVLNYNEYVVYDVNQIKIKFILRVKFLFN